MKAYGISDTGQRRSCNQDYMFCSTDPVGVFADFFILADGMGGHKAGDLASKMTVENYVEFARNAVSVSPRQAMEDGLQYVNHLVYEKAISHEDYEGMGTTVVLCTVEGSDFLILNVGDSRAYAVGSEIYQITKDHSFVAEMVRLGAITPEEALIHPDRHVITRAVGTSDVVKADIFEGRLEEGEKILLCSDGLYNMVPDNIIRDTVDSMDMEDAVNTLIKYANDSGGSDNITVMIIDPWFKEDK